MKKLISITLINTSLAQAMSVMGYTVPAKGTLELKMSVARANSLVIAINSIGNLSVKFNSGVEASGEGCTELSMLKAENSDIKARLDAYEKAEDKSAKAKRIKEAKSAEDKRIKEDKSAEAEDKSAKGKG